MLGLKNKVVFKQVGDKYFKKKNNKKSTATSIL